MSPAGIGSVRVCAPAAREPPCEYVTEIISYLSQRPCDTLYPPVTREASSAPVCIAPHTLLRLRSPIVLSFGWKVAKYP